MDWITDHLMVTAWLLVLLPAAWCCRSGSGVNRAKTKIPFTQPHWVPHSASTDKAKLQCGTDKQ